MARVFMQQKRFLSFAVQNVAAKRCVILKRCSIMVVMPSTATIGWPCGLCAKLENVGKLSPFTSKSVTVRVSTPVTHASEFREVMRWG